MKPLIIFLAVLLTGTSALADEKVKNQLADSRNLILSHPDSAYNLAEEAFTLAELEGYGYGMAQSHFIMGYITKKKGQYDKAIIHYLEADRYAEQANFDGVNAYRVSLLKNSANIFRETKANELSLEYYEKAKDLAKDSDNTKELASIYYNLAFLHEELEELDKAIECSYLALENLSNEDRLYFRVLNKLGDYLRIAERYEESINVLTELIGQLPVDEYQLRGFALHNLALNYSNREMYSETLRYLYRSIEQRKLIDGTQYELFETYLLIGEIFQETGEVDSVEWYFSNAEKYIDVVQFNPEAFELYSLQSEFYFEQGDTEKARRYADLYRASLNEYMEMQEDIRATDRSYSMKLVTKRYFDKLEKEERIADVKFWAFMISGGFFLLLCATLFYNWYSRYRLRKEIENELVALKIIE